MKPLETILLATDFSDTSVAACAPAAELARTYGARILLVHVEDDRLAPLYVEYMAIGLEGLRRQQTEHAKGQLSEFAKAHLPPDAEVEPQVALGVPHLEIVRLASERHADLIVMATHGRGPLSHAVMGSTTERVLRRAPCPVLVVRG